MSMATKKRTHHKRKAYLYRLRIKGYWWSNYEMKEKHAAVDPAMFDQTWPHMIFREETKPNSAPIFGTVPSRRPLQERWSSRVTVEFRVSSEFRQSRSSKRNQEETKISTQGPVSHGRTSFDCWRSLTTKY
jgi:hypothetical protein